MLGIYIIERDITKNMKNLIVCILIIFSNNPEILARDFNFDNDYKLWIIFSLGIANEHDISFGASYNFGYKNFYQVGLYSNSNISIFGNGMHDHITAFTVGYGK